MSFLADKKNWILVVGMAALYVLAGINHFYNPFFYLNIMPTDFPNPEFLVAISGFIEIVLGIGLIFLTTRKLSAWLIVGILIVFFVLIHIPMAIDYYLEDNPMLWLAIVRLPIQFILIWWALKVSKIKRF